MIRMYTILGTTEFDSTSYKMEPDSTKFQATWYSLGVGIIITSTKSPYTSILDAIFHCFLFFWKTEYHSKTRHKNTHAKLDFQNLYVFMKVKNQLFKDLLYIYRLLFFYEFSYVYEPINFVLFSLTRPKRTY